MTRPLPEELEELEKLMAEATTGALEWINFNPKVVFFPRNTNEDEYNVVVTTDGESADTNSDTRYLVALWNAAPALIAACRERDAAVRKLEGLKTDRDSYAIANTFLHQKLDEAEEKLTFRDAAIGSLEAEIEQLRAVPVTHIELADIEQLDEAVATREPGILVDEIGELLMLAEHALKARQALAQHRGEAGESDGL